MFYNCPHCFWFVSSPPFSNHIFPLFFYEPEDGILKIGVSGDGTWQRRGYFSAYGVITVLSIVTGKVPDVEIMSKECRECMVWRQDVTNFSFGGNDSSIFAQQIILVFKRSVENNAFHYTGFLGEEDSKAHKLIVEQAVYGKEKVQKT